MKIPYTETGFDSDQSGVIRQAVLDTDDPEYKRRLGWILSVTRLAEPTFEVVVSPAVGSDTTPNFNSLLKFRFNGETVQVDAYLTYRNPRVTLAVLDAVFNLGIAGIEHMTLPEPPASKPLQDWETPGAKIGPPLASHAGWFTTLWGGETDGAIWTAPSGTRYQLGRVGNGMFAWPAWKRL